jgi:hypothetical protein
MQMRWSWIVLSVVALAVSARKLQAQCAPPTKAYDPVDWSDDTGTWHDWDSGDDWWDDPYGTCGGDDSGSGWGYDDEGDWVYYGDSFDTDPFGDDQIVNIPTPTITCDVGSRPVEFVNQTTGLVGAQWCEPLPEDSQLPTAMEVEAWWEISAMFFDWALGLGPDTATYRTGSIQVAQINGSPGVQKARDAWFDKNRQHIDVEGCHNLESLTNFAYRFGAGGLRDAGGNARRQFVGSFMTSIYPMDDGSAVFQVYNMTSMNSFLYDHGPSWSRETFPPGGNQVQTYTWTEQLCSPT